jgi:hypothetical protein
LLWFLLIINIYIHKNLIHRLSFYGV